MNVTLIVFSGWGGLVCGEASGGSDAVQMVAARLVEVCLSCLYLCCVPKVSSLVTIEWK